MLDIHDIHEQALVEAHKKALVAVKKKATVENIRAAEAAERALNDYRARKNAEANPEERRFANTFEVLGFLTSEGWKVGKSKLYEDCGRGRLLPGRDGTYSLKNVEDYAKDNLGRIDGSDIDGGLANEKTRVEIDLLKARKQKEERLADTISRKLVLRTEVEQRFTNRLALFKTGLENLVYGATTERAVEIVGGNMGKLQEMQDFLMKGIRDILAGYSKSLQFSVPRKAILEAMEEKEEDAN